MTPQDTMRLALEWIEDAVVVLSHTSSAIQGGIGAEAEGVGGCSVQVIKALREALAQPVQEPVGEVLDERGAVDWISFVPPAGTPLYTSPQPAQEPVAWVDMADGAPTGLPRFWQEHNHDEVALYAVAAPAAQPCKVCEEVHAILDTDESMIIRDAKDGYPEGRASRTLTLQERVKALCVYAADWKRWYEETQAAPAPQAQQEPDT